MRKFHYIALTALLLASCSGSDDATETPAVQEQSLSSAANIELPKATKSGNRYTTLVHKIKLGKDSVVNYTVEYDLYKHIPHWVAFKFYSSINSSSVSRTNNWSSDPLVPSAYWVEQSDFAPYERGHMLASADRLVTTEANSQTFYYTNMCPQIGQGFNENIWAQLEAKVRTWRSNYDTLYVVRGPIYTDDTPCTQMGSVHIPVATHFYMALLGRKQDTFQAIAFCLEHKNFGTNSSTYPSILTAAAMSIDDLEAKTGLDLFPNLPDKLETTVESSYFISNWNVN